MIVIFRHFFLCPPLLPLAPFVSSILCEILVYIPGCASIAECQLTIGFKIVCSPVDTHYTVVWRVSKRQKKEEETSRIQKQNTEPRLKCFRLCRYLLSGKWTFCSILFLILPFISLFLYLSFLLKCLSSLLLSYSSRFRVC